MNIVLGVTGCIAAYKSALILRLLMERDAQVFAVMTRSALRFLGALTLEKLSGHRVVHDLFDDESAEIEHISLARKSDLLLVAPATANVLGKFAHGVADDFLSTLYLSTTTPVVVAPAMNVEMWRHPATRRNVEILRERGVEIVEPSSGFLACGEVGEGRLADPEDIVEAVLARLRPGKDLLERRVVITAGPTVEDIDPVRFISNRSSGRMGYALAEAAARRGARTILISGPTSLDAPAGVELVRVRSAGQMQSAVLEHAPQADAIVMAAAVSDFAPARKSKRKIKKGEASPVLELERTPDILKGLGAARREGQVLVGFAAESENLEKHAQEKLESKNLDLVVANDISSPDSGFASQENEAVLLGKGAFRREIPRMSKRRMADIIWDEAATLLQGQPVP